LLTVTAPRGDVISIAGGVIEATIDFVVYNRFDGRIAMGAQEMIVVVSVAFDFYPAGSADRLLAVLTKSLGDRCRSCQQADAEQQQEDYL
jgi:hypothetical protein